MKRAFAMALVLALLLVAVPCWAQVGRYRIMPARIRNAGTVFAVLDTTTGRVWAMLRDKKKGFFAMYPVLYFPLDEAMKLPRKSHPKTKWKVIPH